MQPSDSISAPQAQQRECREHGPYMASRIQLGSADLEGRYGPRWEHCPKCVEAEGARRQEELTERRRKHIESLIACSGVRGRYVEATFDTYRAETPQQRRALQACRQFVDAAMAGEASTLFLLGRPGTGKTHLGCAIVRAVIEREARAAHIVTVSAFVRDLRATWDRARASDDASTEEQVLRRYGHAAMLVLDDVGAAFQSQAAEKHLLDLVDERYTHQLPTVVASNLNEAELQAAVGERTFDRLSERAKCVTFTWPSHRGTV